MTGVLGGKASFLYSRWAHGNELLAMHGSITYARRAKHASEIASEGYRWALWEVLSLGTPPRRLVAHQQSKISIFSIYDKATQYHQRLKTRNTSITHIRKLS